MDLRGQVGGQCISDTAGCLYRRGDSSRVRAVSALTRRRSTVLCVWSATCQFVLLQ